MTLEWRQLPTSEVSYITACGKYSVGFDGQHRVWRAYRLAPGGPWFAPIGHEATIEGAKQVAEADAA